MKSSDFGNFLQILRWDIANKKVNFLISVHRYFFLFNVNKKTINKKKWLVEILKASYNFYVLI